MSVLYQKDVTSFPAALTIPTTTETVIAQSNVVPVQFQTAKINISVYVVFLFAGMTVTGVVIRVYRGTPGAGAVLIATSPNLGTMIQPGPASFAPTPLVFETTDAGVAGTVQYTVSVQQTLANGNGTASNVQLEVEVLSG